jgi:hypothetical protein
MATLGTTVATLSDWAKTLDPDGKTASIVELLAQTNEVLSDMLWIQGNLPTGHRTTVRTGLPSVAWRLLNAGVTPSKASTAQIDEQCGILEAWSEVDVELAKLNGNEAAYRLQEAQAFIEAMNQEFVQTLFYGNGSTIAPEEFVGLSPRYSSTSAANGQNILLAGSASGSDQASMWLVVWGANTVHGIFPKGSTAGLQHEDLGVETVETSAGMGGTRMRAYRDRFVWKAGIALKDWRYAVRIANIDDDTLDAAGSAVPLIDLMIKATHRIPSLNMGRPVFYANRSVHQYLDIQANRKSNVYLNAGSEEGQRKVTFRGIPIRVCDGLLQTESVVS